MPVPPWVSDAIFYQIFPDRFANGDPANDPPGAQPWGSPPTIWDFQGGDLAGVRDRLDYLADLGVNALYLNPIFEAASNHRYNTTDYYRIDPHLGGDETFAALLDETHRRGFRLILDGVFNHCGRGFFAFYDLMERESHSAYRDWYHVRRFPLEAYGPGEAENYRGWWDMKSLPKFNTSNPEVRRYLFGVARHWIERGVDGWRLDVPNEIDDDSFWAEFRQVVKTANPEAYLFGEIWAPDPRWVGETHFDGLMLYAIRDLLLDLLARKVSTPTQFLESLAKVTRVFPDGYRESHYLPLGSHDTERILTLCDKDARKVRLAALVGFTFPGAPAVYYGDEIGLQGGKDPDSRRAFPWDERRWDHALRDFFKALIRTRRNAPQLRRGEIIPLRSDDAVGVCAYGRRWQDRTAAVAFNASETAHRVEIPLASLGWRDGLEVVDPLGGGRFGVQNGRIVVSLAAFEGILLLPPA